MKCWLVYEDRIPPDCKWYQRPLKRSYRHCWLLWYDDIGWYYLNATHGYLATSGVYLIDGVSATSKTEEEVLWYFKQMGCSFQDVTFLLDLRDPNKMRTPYHLTINNCVEACKSYLAISGFWIMTPWQLHQHIEQTRSTIHGIK